MILRIGRVSYKLAIIARPTLCAACLAAGELIEVKLRDFFHFSTTSPASLILTAPCLRTSTVSSTTRIIVDGL